VSAGQRSAGLAGLLARAEERLIPVAVTLELTGRCNFACRHCVVPDHGVSDGLTTARVLALLDELAAMGTLFLTFTGGEPLLRDDWARVALRARELGFSLRLFTNASRVDERAADLLARLPAAVEVSLYSMNPAVFEGITGVPGSLARTLAGVERLLARGVEVTLKAPAMTVNLGDVGEVREYARSVGAAFRTDALIVCRDDGDPAPLCLRIPPRELGEYHRWQLPGAGARLESPAPVASDEPPCAAGIRMAAVTAAGDMLACLQLRTPAGNVNRASFRRIWERSPWLQRLRQVRVRDLEECAGCTRLAYCQRCPAQALVEDGDLLGPSRWSCEHAASLEHAFARDP
jgi:radical SAM protein with 4Fe4S-binding SPASM domain